MAFLGSDYLALDSTTIPSELVLRLHHDPRLEVVYGGYNVLFHVRRPADLRFIIDWKPVAGPSSGFIDATTIAHECATLTREEQVVATSNRRYEFAPWGPSTIAIDGTVRATVSSPHRAILGRGARFELTLAPGVHRFEVRTCRSAAIAGFYLTQSPAAS